MTDDDRARMMVDLRDTVRQLGMAVDMADIIADGVHMVVHLRPADVVARVATLYPQDTPSQRRRALAHELDVANHLLANGVGAVRPADLAGPHPVQDTWFTLWRYYAARPGAPAVTSERLWEAIRAFREAFDGPQGATVTQRPVLAPLVPWRAAAEGARRLAGTPWFEDPKIAELLRIYNELDAHLASMPLVPAHGDAHPGNLLVAGDGKPRWLDFEDVSLMPVHWDHACVVARARLLGLGVNHASWVERAVLAELPEPALRDEWHILLLARAVQITLVGRFFEAYGHEEAEVTAARIEGTQRLLASIKLP
ncbi:phosphotransferase [Micromonosporaceae bacterium B7E4]